MTWIPADTGSVTEVARRLRQGDVDEAKAMYGVNARYILPAVFDPTCTWVLQSDTNGENFGIAGVSPTGTEGVGQIWMVATDAIHDHRMELLRGTKPFIAEMHNRGYPILFNWVDVRQQDSIAWLKWAGFKAIAYHEKFGVAGIPFTTMVRIRECA